jgi:hypothetical protein
MKKNRLLEIIREEISSALTEVNNVLVTNKKGETTSMPFNTPDEKKTITNLKSDSNITNIKTTSGQNIKEEKRKKLAEKYQLDEETINEMASIKQLKSELERQGKETELKAVAAAERAALDSLKADPTITSDGRLKGYVPTLKKELLNTHNIKLQDLLSQVAGKAEDDGVKFSSDIATNTIEKDAANQITGKEAGQRGRKADPNKPEKPASTGKKGRPTGKPKAEKIATLTTGDDGFDNVEYSDDEESAAAAKAAGSDEMAKKLGNTPEEKKIKFNQFLSSVKKNKEDKAKVDAILKLAKDKFKLSSALINDLKRAAGREVEA